VAEPAAAPTLLIARVSGCRFGLACGLQGKIRSVVVDGLQRK
jgi:hypothetical protein